VTHFVSAMGYTGTIMGFKILREAKSDYSEYRGTPEGDSKIPDQTLAQV